MKVKETYNSVFKLPPEPPIKEPPSAKTRNEESPSGSGEDEVPPSPSIDPEDDISEDREEAQNVDDELGFEC